ncbi:unnamed protein product [Urochloa humidicola]
MTLWKECWTNTSLHFKSILDGKYLQTMGMVVECSRLDKLEGAISRCDKIHGALSYNHTASIWLTNVLVIVNINWRF